ncbi:hypothetical protein ACWEK5_32565 [Rhodococcus koreensis]
MIGPQAVPGHLLWLVRSRPLSGSESDYHRWYDEVHLPEVLAQPGMLAAYRYSAPTVGDARDYIAAYVVESSAVIEEVSRRMHSGEMTGCKALDPASATSEVFTSLGPDKTKLC